VNRGLREESGAGRSGMWRLRSRAAQFHSLSCAAPGEDHGAADDVLKDMAKLPATICGIEEEALQTGLGRNGQSGNTRRAEKSGFTPTVTAGDWRPTF